MTIPSTSAINVFDRHLLRARRERASAHIRDYDFLLKAVADRLIDRLSLVRRELPVVLDLGAHHGVLSDLLMQRPGTAHVFSSDLAGGLAAQSSAMSFVADEEFLPVRTGSVDAVISNLSMQWINDLPGALFQIRHALKDDGVFMGALLGGESLKELRLCLMEAEMQVTNGASPRVSPFIDLRDMGALMQRAGFALPVVDSEIITVDYSHPLKLMRDLRGMGVGNAVHNRLRLPTRRAVMMEAARIYQEKFGDARGYVPATFEIVYAIGWKPHESQQKPLKPGTAAARLADQLNTIELPAGEITNIPK